MWNLLRNSLSTKQAPVSVPTWRQAPDAPSSPRERFQQRLETLTQGSSLQWQLTAAVNPDSVI